MSLFANLRHAPRLLLEAKLRPMQGERFQPTGFADLGAAVFTVPNGPRKLLLESVQSVANRLEMVTWDTSAEDLIEPLRGLPYVRVHHDDRLLTNSILEAHRLNSPYVLEGADKSFFEELKSALGVSETGAVQIPQVAKTVLRYDANAILHGLFLVKKELAGGRIRLQRLLSGFIEATDVKEVESGGVKNDRINPSGDTSKGFGNVPFHRTEWTAESITAYFNLDLAGLRAYSFGEETEELMIALSLWKIQAFLQTGLRLRTACDLEAGSLTATRPAGFEIPSLRVLTEELPRLIQAVPHFVDPRVRIVNWVAPKAGKAGKGEEAVE